MSNADDSSRRAKQPATELPRGEYKVGFRKPPVEHQFKPGNKANPRGRGKGTRNRKVILRDLLLEPISVREGETVRKVSKLGAIVTQTINDALKGDHKSRLIALAMARESGLLTPEQEEAIEENLSERDKQIMEDYNRRIRARPSSSSKGKTPEPPSGHPDRENRKSDVAESPPATAAKGTNVAARDSSEAGYTKLTRPINRRF
jgi:hypothetical protein